MHKALNKIRVGNAVAPDTDIGPVVDETQLQQDLDYIQVGKDEGATLLCGGERLELDSEGYFLSPALFVDTHNDMRINREEIFGPVASVIKVADYDEAVKIANDTAFGLCAGICTTSLKKAEQFKRQSQAGMVMVNLPTAGVDYHVPFGGTKASSYGAREQGRYAAEFYTKVKTSYIQP
jgi:aldehyde dehydrogenase (NAD+)